jgi:DNA-binding CsgD family transcriptional regulator
MDQSPFSRVVGSVYDCIADEGLWPASLESVSRYAEGCLATLGVIDTSQNAARFLASWGDPAILQPLIGQFGKNVSFFGAVQQMQIDTPYTVDAIYGIQGEGAREKWIGSSIAQEWVIPNQLDDFFWVPLIKQPTRTGTLVVVTDKSRRKIDDGDIQRMTDLAPHVRRAVTIGDLFTAEQRKAAVFQSVLDALQTSVIIVGKNLGIMFLNAAADGLLREGTILASKNKQLCCTYLPAQRSISHAVEVGNNSESSLASLGINVPLGRSETPAVAHNLPLARRDRSIRIAESAIAAIFVGLSGQTLLPAIDAISALFGLTSAEARVANLVAAGNNRQQIAESCGTSPTTVQTQLSAIYDKTHTHDQRSLGQLIHELSPPVRGKGP